MRFAAQALAAVTFSRFGSALRVATNSPCGVKCGNVLDATTSDDMVCTQSAYSSSSAGIVFSGCVTCESTSNYTYGSKTTLQSDLQWMLYNLRYATAYCLFGDPDNSDLANNPCITSTACGPLKTAIEIDSLSPNASEYSYCAQWSDQSLSKCTACLEQMDNGHYLSNFVRVLDGACSVQPQEGSTLSIQGNIFSSDVVNVTTATPTASASTNGISGPLSVGGIVGVAIGGVVFILAIVGCCIVIIGRRKRRAYLQRREEQHKHWPAQYGVPEMFETPVSQRPLHNWDESPVSAVTDHMYPQYFSPYSSNYNSPVSAADAVANHHNMHWPTAQATPIGMALSPNAEHNLYTGDRKGKDREMTGEESSGRNEYEMQEGVSSGGGDDNKYIPRAPPEPPVLGHPGYGRQGPSPEWRSGENMGNQKA